MSTHLALLRAVNVGGRNPVAMPQLVALCARLGLEDARTLLQSGNLVFRGGSRPAAALERLLEAEFAREFGFPASFFVRTAREWRALVDANPFPREASRDPGRLVVAALKEAPRAGAEDALRAAIVGREVARVDGRTAYIYYRDGQGRSKLTHALLEKTLGTSATARNWNTALKLGALLGR